MVRQYSLCNNPEERHRYLIAVLRDPASRGGSIAMHERVHEGDVIRIGEPKNHFPLVHAKRTLLFAGGIGAEFEMHISSRHAARERRADASCSICNCVAGWGVFR
jgi:vanillate O-demethylase ferredoxin subunit